MPKPVYEVVAIGQNCYTINDRGRTVALVTSQGYIDWLLKSPLQNGPLIPALRKETHFSYTLGLKLLLITPKPTTELTAFSWEVGKGGSPLVLRGEAATKDGAFRSPPEAILDTDPTGSRYEWRLTTTITCAAPTPQTVPWVEFNNVYAGTAGRCFLYQRWKEYNCNLLVDRNGVVWKFPHQHLLHYTAKTSQLHFQPGTLGGFFGEKDGNP